LYYDDPTYTYNIESVDFVVKDCPYKLEWNNTDILFEYTPGHSFGSVCIVIGNMIFTGDIIMPFKPYLNKRDGSKELYAKSIEYMSNKYSDKGYQIYPGHGDSFEYVGVKA